MMPPKLPPLSRSEWRLMYCIWELGEASPPEVSEHLQSLGEELTPKTVGIYLTRLEEKGYLRSAPVATAARGRPKHTFQAAVTRLESLRWQMERFLEDHLIDQGDASLLREMLEQGNFREVRTR